MHFSTQFYYTIFQYKFTIQFFIIQFPAQFYCTTLVHPDKGWWCLNCRNSWSFNQSWLLLRVNYTGPLHHLSGGFRRNLKQKFKRILKKNDSKVYSIQRFCFTWSIKGQMASPKRMNFRKSSKRPLTPPLIFEKSYCGFRDKSAYVHFGGTVIYYMILFPMRCM